MEALRRRIYPAAPKYSAVLRSKPCRPSVLRGAGTGYQQPNVGEEGQVIPFRNKGPSKDAPLFFRRPIRGTLCVAVPTERVPRGRHVEKEQVDWRDFYCELVLYHFDIQSRPKVRGFPQAG